MYCPFETTTRNTYQKLSIPRIIEVHGSRLPIDRMTCAIHWYEVGWDPVKASNYMKHYDQLGISIDIYGYKHKCLESSDAQLSTAQEKVLKVILILFSVNKNRNRNNHLYLLFEFKDAVANGICQHATVQVLKC